MRDDENQEFPILFKILVIIVILSALFGTFMSLIDFALVKSASREISRINRTLLASMSDRINNMENDISNVKSSLMPGGIMDLYVNAYHFLSNSQVDLEKIVTLAEGTNGKTYFSFYITGESGVWIGISKGGRYVFQSEMKQGLSPERFYVNNTPKISTSYTFTVDSSTVIMSGSPSRTYILMVNKKGAKIVKMSSTRVLVKRLFNK